MNYKEVLNLYKNSQKIIEVNEEILQCLNAKISLRGLKGSSKAIISSAFFSLNARDYLFILSDKEGAVYFMNDLQSFIEPGKILFFPSPYTDEITFERHNPSTLDRIEVLNKIKTSTSTGRIVITYPEALSEYVVPKEEIQKNTTVIKVNSKLDIDFMIEFLIDYGFERTDFVSEAGYFSIRGGIIDIFSYANNLPYRIELLDDKIESIREFDPETQLSTKKLDSITIIPNLEENNPGKKYMPFLKYLTPGTVIVFNNFPLIKDTIDKQYKAAQRIHRKDNTVFNLAPKDILTDSKEFVKEIENFQCIDFGNEAYFSPNLDLGFNTSAQPNFNKNFNLLAETLINNEKNGITNYIFSESINQIERIYAIFEDQQVDVKFIPIYKNLHEGFIDKDLKIACFTEHQIFNRFHKSKRRKSFSNKRYLSLKELYELKPGDYVTHINHGIGRFSGLEKIDIKGEKQESVRIEYKDGDLLYISIHSLYKIARYIGKEGKAPKLHRIGSNVWENQKLRTKSKVKDIARDLIRLYVARRTQKGFEFTIDSYLQTELEASFIYEDTPDQNKATEDVKRDMEKPYPMDRLVCGDVGYGKTEVAIRAAFKAVTDSKQVAILVPTTILALQHFKTLSDRLAEFPCTVDHLSRFKSYRSQKEITSKLREGKLDIIIGTHKLLSKDIRFKDLGLLIIDEEQKFGVAAKEKLRSIKVNVDTLALSATPIPRTLQFSLMGARDLSIINTPPPNRQPIETRLIKFDHHIIREAINNELERRGQVFFVHNRIKDIFQIEGILKELVPHAKIGIAHGQMPTKELEEVMLGFIDGFFDVLLSTNIIESGLDIPNANTIIINNAQNFGLSDLHQMRGRVGRSNIKAYCYLLIPSFTAITSDARKRLSAIEEFTDLGSGFNIAMRDLDIRGAGNLLGAEQSGFIGEIGLEMYKRILDEAMIELRNEDEFKDIFEDRNKVELFKECQIDTDFEVLIPDEYINNVEERLVIYNKLNRIKTENELKEYKNNLIDRFGKLPPQTLHLLNLIRLKWIGQRLGIQKIILRNNKLKAIFPVSQVTNPEFQTQIFEKILSFAKRYPEKCQFIESSKGLNLISGPIDNFDSALTVLRNIEES